MEWQKTVASSSVPGYKLQWSLRCCDLWTVRVRNEDAQLLIKFNKLSQCNDLKYKPAFWNEEDVEGEVGGRGRKYDNVTQRHALILGIIQSSLVPLPMALDKSIIFPGWILLALQSN